MEQLKFPEGFKWGSATSAHQIEGDNHNDWTEWERANSARLANEAARRYSNALARIKEETSKPENYISGKACNSYLRYEEDFDIAKKLNQNIHRFSIEWSRIEPEEGKFDLEAMQHYIDVVKALCDRGIEPMVTLWHFTNPDWFAKKGGFLNKKSPEIFTRYIKYVVDNLKDRVGLWITFNEPLNVYAGLSYLRGYWPPQHKSLLDFLKVRRNMLNAHMLAYREIKKIYKNRVFNEYGQDQLGMSHNINPLVGVVENNSHIVSGTALKALGIGRIVDYLWNLYFWRKAIPYQDFLGLNYYTITRLPGSYGILSKQEVAEEMNWEIYPEGIYHCLMKLKKFNKPIFITENGIADSTDQKREKFIKDHLCWVWRAIQDGADVRGYLYWSLLDNFEWAKGFAPRFGLVEIDYKIPPAGGERKIRPSALEYAKICKENAMQINE